jgi:hypothetical protein
MNAVWMLAAGRSSSPSPGARLFRPSRPFMRAKAVLAIEQLGQSSSPLAESTAARNLAAKCRQDVVEARVKHDDEDGR